MDFDDSNTELMHKVIVNSKKAFAVQYYGYVLQQEEDKT